MRTTEFAGLEVPAPGSVLIFHFQVVPVEVSGRRVVDMLLHVENDGLVEPLLVKPVQVEAITLHIGFTLKSRDQHKARSGL
jgi:hypothetical protein